MFLFGGQMVDIICKNCGNIYTGNEIPAKIVCICESTDFEMRETDLTGSKVEEVEA